MYSDNALTFNKARRVLAATVEWRFIASRSPWWGGFYERLIGSVKSSLRRVLGRRLIPFRELETLLVEIEGALNRRPLTTVSDQIDDNPPLTPLHFMDGAPSASDSDDIPQDFGATPFLVPSWRKRRELLRRWWNQWRKSYLMGLHEWHTLKPSSKYLPKVGDVVLVGEDGASRVKWPLGRVHHIIEGSDGFPRATLVKRGNL